MAGRVDVRTGLVELDRDECYELLARAPLGRLGVVVGGRPLVFPVNFTLDGDAVVVRTAEGTKLHGARHAPVAFECDGTDGVYHTGWSVLVLGSAEEVEHPIDVARLERLPLAPWSDVPKPVWLRIRPESISGRRVPPHGPAATAARRTEEER